MSTFTATILLAYALAQYVHLPAQHLPLRFAGVYVDLTINIDTLTAVLVAGLVASGMDGLLHTHPQRGRQSSVIHWLLPALSAWVLGLSLRLLRPQQTWWAGVLIGGVVLTLVCVAEYIVMGPQDALYPWAASGLTALGFGLFLALAMSLHTAEIRLLWRLPALAAGAALISLRVLHLRLAGSWAVWETYAAAALTMQTGAVLHYLPLSPARYGMMLLAPLYALVTWVEARAEGRARPWVEAGITALLLTGVALWL